MGFLRDFVKNLNVLQRTLTDIRDGETYRVRKLADGNVWMTENLRKEFTAGEILKPATTDVKTNTTVDLATQPYNQSSDNYYGWGVASDSDLNASTVDRWLSRSTKVGSTWATETNPSRSDAPKVDHTGEDQRLGVYYNWYTATASTGNWGITADLAEATSSICPSGWQLPKHNSDAKSWLNLIKNTYSLVVTEGNGNSEAVNRLYSFPFNLPLSGFISYASGAVSQGGQGVFWESTSHYRPNARDLKINPTGGVVYTGSTDNRLFGQSVRCVSK